MIWAVPFNKAAYVFGTASIAEGNYDIMAAVMVGGMVPPLVIALCTTFFKNRFTPSERKSGAVNYIMGLCFISEGAIPYAAADPLRVIPSCIVGSAVSGALSMAFGCTLMVLTEEYLFCPGCRKRIGIYSSACYRFGCGSAPARIFKKAFGRKSRIS